MKRIKNTAKAILRFFGLTNIGPRDWLLLILLLTILIAIFMPIYGYCALRNWNNWKPLGFEAKEWVSFYTVIAAIIGWITTSFVQITNSVKQHTVNTMLQSRLSTTFQEKYSEFMKCYHDLPTETYKTAEDWKGKNIDETAAIKAAGYLLNYYEFVAVGIRAGDFNEQLMRRSLNSIVINLVNATRHYINFYRKLDASGRATSPSTYANLIWLYDRWQNDPLQPLEEDAFGAVPPLIKRH